MPQSVFLINDTIKNNILFGKEYNQERYVNAVVKSGFFADLRNLAAQDMTEIGERGVNLSGGQKQRIAIARALYAFADIYLMDDVLSALDAEVGKFVFDNLICGDLKDKTRILVTHATYLLHKCDEVLVMKDGQIQAHGKYEEIKTHPAFLEYSTAAKKEKEEEKNEEETVQKVKKNLGVVKKVAHKSYFSIDREKKSKVRMPSMGELTFEQFGLEPVVPSLNNDKNK